MSLREAVGKGASVVSSVCVSLADSDSPGSALLLLVLQRPPALPRQAGCRTVPPAASS